MSNQSEAERDVERDEAASRMRKMRSNQTEVERDADRIKNATRNRNVRSNQTEEEKELRRRKVANRMAVLRANMDDDESAVDREQNRIARYEPLVVKLAMMLAILSPSNTQLFLHPPPHDREGAIIRKRVFRP